MGGWNWKETTLRGTNTVNHTHPANMTPGSQNASTVAQHKAFSDKAEFGTTRNGTPGSSLALCAGAAVDLQDRVFPCREPQADLQEKPCAHFSGRSAQAAPGSPLPAYLKRHSSNWITWPDLQAQQRARWKKKAALLPTTHLRRWTKIKCLFPRLLFKETSYGIGQRFQRFHVRTRKAQTILPGFHSNHNYHDLWLKSFWIQ